MTRSSLPLWRYNFRINGVYCNANWTKIYIDTSKCFGSKQNLSVSSFKWMYWFCINLSRSRFVWILNFGHFTRDCVGKFAAKMHNLQNSNEPWSREIYAKPLYTFERGGSEVSFDTKTFRCVYVNFCSIGITIQSILCENYTTTKIENC